MQISAEIFRSLRHCRQRLAPLEIAVRDIQPLVQRERRGMQLLVERALPLCGASIGALVAEVDAAAERALLVLAAEPGAEVRTVAARACFVDFVEPQRIRCPRGARSIDALNHERSF